MSAPESNYREKLCKLLGVSPLVSDKELKGLIDDRIEKAGKLTQLDWAARELESSAKVAAKAGMYESGAAMRNKAAGIRIAIEILTTGGAL